MYDSEMNLLKNGTPLKFYDKQTEKEILWTQNGTPRTGYRHIQRKIFKMVPSEHKENCKQLRLL